MKAVYDDELFVEFVNDPGFLQNMLPISAGADALLRRILDLDPRRRITLPRLRKAVLELDTFFISEEEFDEAAEFAEIAAAAIKLDGPSLVDGDILADAVGDLKLDDEDIFAPRTPRPAYKPWTGACSESSEGSSIGPVTPEASTVIQAVLISHDDNEIEEVAREPVKGTAPPQIRALVGRV